MPYPDYYKTLQLDTRASEEQIWLSFHKLEYLYSKGKLEGGESKLFLAGQAYRVLKDRQAREAYDRWYQEYLRSQSETKNFRRLLVSFFTSFFAAGVVALLLGIAPVFALSSSSVYYVIFVILIAVVVLTRNKLKNNEV